MELVSNPKVKTVFDKYPKHVKDKLLLLRGLILKTASEIEGLDRLEETLKWGEPSYLTKYGSTLRIDWKEKSPDQIAIYFQFTSRLIPTFKTVYKNIFEFQGNRAILLKLNSKIPETQLKHCISMTLTYHKIKHIPLLGA